jgi:hypothetical protein
MGLLRRFSARAAVFDAQSLEPGTGALAVRRIGTVQSLTVTLRAGRVFTASVVSSIDATAGDGRTSLSVVVLRAPSRTRAVSSLVAKTHEPVLNVVSLDGLEAGRCVVLTGTAMLQVELKLAAAGPAASAGVAEAGAGAGAGAGVGAGDDADEDCYIVLHLVGHVGAGGGLSFTEGALMTGI